MGLSDVALSALVRLATNPRVFARPDSAADVLAYIGVLCESPGQILLAGLRWRSLLDG